MTVVDTQHVVPRVEDGAGHADDRDVEGEATGGVAQAAGRVAVVGRTLVGRARPAGRSPCLPSLADVVPPSDADSRLSGRLLTVVVLALVVVALSASAALHGRLVALLHEVQAILGSHPVGGPVAFVLLAAASALLAFFSSALLVPAGVVTWGMAATALLLAVGWFVGGLVAYALARWVGRPVVARLTKPGRLAAWEQRLGPRTPFGVVFLFQLALPSEVPGYVLGLVRYPLARYAAALLLVEGPFAAITVWIGEEFLARRVLPILAALAGAALVGVVASSWLRRRLEGGARR